MSEEAPATSNIQVPSADTFVTVQRPKNSKNPDSFWLVVKEGFSGMIMVGDGRGNTKFKYTKRLLVKPKSEREREIQARQASGEGRQQGGYRYQQGGGYGGQRGGYGWGRRSYGGRY